jgi:hypothetical protein
MCLQSLQLPSTQSGSPLDLIPLAPKYHVSFKVSIQLWTDFFIFRSGSSDIRISEGILYLLSRGLRFRLQHEIEVSYPCCRCKYGTSGSRSCQLAFPVPKHHSVRGYGCSRHRSLESRLISARNKSHCVGTEAASPLTANLRTEVQSSWTYISHYNKTVFTRSWFLIRLEARMFLSAFSLCVGNGLATGWSPVQGVPPTVYK